MLGKNFKKGDIVYDPCFGFTGIVDWMEGFDHIDYVGAVMVSSFPLSTKSLREYKRDGTNIYGQVTLYHKKELPLVIYKKISSS